jgi:hypothetical protein
MSTFTDKDGKDWSLELTVGIVKRIRNRHQLDIVALDKGALEQLATDPMLLADVLFVICEEEVKSREMSAEEFALALGGNAIDDATNALVEAIIDFFPRRRRPLLRQARAKLDQLEKIQDQELAKMVETANFKEAAKVRLAEVQRRFQSQLSTPGASSGN